MKALEKELYQIWRRKGLSRKKRTAPPLRRSAGPFFRAFYDSLMSRYALTRATHLSQPRSLLLMHRS